MIWDETRVRPAMVSGPETVATSRRQEAELEAAEVKTLGDGRDQERSHELSWTATWGAVYQKGIEGFCIFYHPMPYAVCRTKTTKFNLNVIMLL